MARRSELLLIRSSSSPQAIRKNQNRAVETAQVIEDADRVGEGTARGTCACSMTRSK